jgi:hypothetical protein
MKSFSQVTTQDLKQLFDIDSGGGMFIPSVKEVIVPSWLVYILERQKKNLAMLRNEKALSEAIISPILMGVQEVFENKVTVFSGEPLATKDISGVCDFLITKVPKAFEPKGGGYLVLVEAKKQDLLSGIPQCIAEMYAAQVLNENNETVYGCVTTGLEWLFIKLENNVATIHSNVYTLSEVPTILGVFDWIINQ